MPNVFADPSFGADAAAPNPFSNPEFGKKQGAVSYLASQAKAGLTADLPTIAGKALQYAGANDIGSRMRAYGEANAAEAQPDENQGAITKLAAGAIRGAAPIVPLAVGGLAANVLAPQIAVPLELGGAAALAGGFGGAQAQDTLEKAKAAGLSDEQATSAARKTGLITGVGMGAVGALTGGMAAPAIRAIASPVAKTAAESLAQTAAPTFARPFLADTAGHLVGNVASMAAANAGTAAVEQQAGLPGPTPGQAALEGLESGAGLTAALLPFGAARTALATRANAAAVARLQNPNTDPQQRADIAARIHANINALDPQAANHFAENVSQSIDLKQPIDLGEHLLKPFEAPTAAKPEATPPEAPDLTTSPGAGVPPAPNAVDFTREVDTAGLSLAPSQKMGIDPNAGPISRAAAIAVDSGAHDDAVARAAEAAKATDETPAKTAAPVEQAAAVAREAGGEPERGAVAAQAGNEPAGQSLAAVEGANRGAGQGESLPVAGDSAARVEPAADRAKPQDVPAGEVGKAGGAEPVRAPAAEVENKLPIGKPTPHEEAASQHTAKLQDNELDAVHTLADQLPEPNPKSQIPVRSALRQIGFTEPEIKDAFDATKGAAATAENGPRAGGAEQATQGKAQGNADLGKGEAQAKPLSVGITPNQTEPISVKSGIVHIGKNEALNFDTGEPIKVAAGASEADIRKALKDGGALSKRQKFFGGEAAQDQASSAKQPKVKAEVAPQVRYGQDGVTMAEGGKPFVTKLQAMQQQKNMPQTRIVKHEGGFALIDMSDKALDAARKSGNRLQAALRAKSRDENPLLAFLAEHGLYHEDGKPNSQKAEFSPDKNINVRGFGNIFRANGLKPDVLASRAADAGFLKPGTEDERALTGLIERAIKGERIIPQYAEGEVEKEMQAQIERHKELADLKPQDADAEGYDRASATMQEHVRAIMSGVSEDRREAVLEDVAKRTENATDDEYLAAVREALESVVPSAREVGAQDRDRADGKASAESAQQGKGEGLTSPTERYAAGNALTKQQRREVLRTLTDVYKTKGAPREQKGVGRDGNERYGYVHSPDLFEKSDITGAMVRYHVTLPDGRRAHPSELFPDFTQAEIDKAMLEQDAAEKQDAASQSEVERRAEKYAAATPPDAQASFLKRNLGFEVRDWRTGKDRAFVTFEKGGKFFTTTDDDVAHMARLERAGWTRPEALTAPTPAEVIAAQDRTAAAPATEAKQQIDREAEHQTLTQQTAPEQRKDTTGDLLGGPSAAEALQAKRKADEAKAKPKYRDPAVAQKLINSIQEGEGILKSGKNSLEKKLTPEQLDAVRRSVESTRAKLVALEGDGTAPMFSKASSLELDRLSDAHGEQRAATINLADAQRDLQQWEGFQRRSPGYKRAETRNNIAKAQRAVERAKAALERADAAVTDAQAKVDALHPLDDPRNQMALFRQGKPTEHAGLSREQFSTEMGKAFGAKTAERLEKNGVVIPIEDQSSLPDHVVPFVRSGDTVYGFYDPKTDRTYAVLSNLTPEMVKGLALHEVGVHYGFENMLGKDRYGQVIARIKAMGRMGNAEVKAALEQAKKNAAAPSQIPEETLAYMVQNHADIGIIRTVISQIKAFLFNKFGIGGGSLNADDITALAKAAVQHSSRTEPGARRPDFAAKESVMADTNRRSFIVGTAAVLASGEGKADAKLGRATALAEKAANAPLSTEIAKVLRGNGATNPSGAKAIKQALQMIAQSGPEQLRALASRIADLMPERGVMLTVEKGDYNAHGAVELSPIPHMRLFDGTVSQGLRYSTFMHESLHVAVLARYRSLSSGVLRSNDKVIGVAEPKAAPALEQFKNLWTEFREATRDLPKGAVSLEEARRTPDEFFVRALTDPELQATLSRLKYQGRTLFERFKDWVKTSLFGFGKSEGTEASWLDAALTASNDLLGLMKGDAADFNRASAIERVNSRTSSAPNESSLADRVSFSRGPASLDRMSDTLDRIKSGVGNTGAAKNVSTAWDGVLMATAPQYRSDAAREMSRQLIEGMGEKEMRSIKFRTELNAAVRESEKATTLGAKGRDLLEKGLTVQADKAFLKSTPEENRAFMQAMDTGDAKYFDAHPDLKPMAEVIGKMFSEKAAAIQKLGTGALQAIRENYFPHIWKDEPKADAQQQIFSTLAKRPLEGKKAFTKERVFDDVQAGLDAGYEPISNNPLDIVALKMEEMDKYLLAHTVLKNMEGSNGVHLIAAGEKTPKGFTDVNGRFGSIEREGEKLRYVARDDVAQVINNYLSQSLYHNKYVGKPFTAYMGAANTLNQFQLGVFSAFHAGFTSMEAVISHASIGIKALTAGDLKGAAKYLSTAPAAWITNPKLGSKIVEAMTGTAAHPEVAPILEGLQMAGFKWQMDNRFRTDATKNMLQAWSEGRKFKAGLNSIPAMVEQTARPILEWLVPRQKFGVFGEMYSKWMQDNPNASHEELRNSAQQIWNRVDSRLGQVVYDRLFMHNVTKNFAQMLIRAPGWTGGTILEVGGGIKDLAGYAKALASGKRPEAISDRAAYTLSMLTITALSNAILTGLFTGAAPDDWRDLVAFRTGNLDEKGRPERFMLPTYMKDVHAYAEAPGHTLVAKAHPLLSLVGDIGKNRDFYGTEIRSEDASLLTQLGQTAGFAAKAFVPFWVKGVQKEREREGSALATVAPLVGVMPAPSDLNKTAAEKLMTKYGADRLPQGSRTQEETDKANLRRQMYVALRKGEQDKAKEAFDQGREQGLFGARDYLKVVRQARKDPLVSGFEHLTFEQAQRVMNVASDDEKRELAPLFMKKRMAYQRQHAGQGA